MINAVLNDVMCEHPIKIKESINVGRAAHLLFRYRINGILIVSDTDEDKLIGIFTTTDLLNLLDKALANKAKRIKKLETLAQMPVGKVCSKKVVSMQKDDKITKAIAMMHKKKIHTIPVYEDGKIAGVVGKHDILNISLNYY